MRANLGYTLLEVVVATSVMTGMFLASGTVLVNSVRTWRAAEAYTAATAAVRDASLSIAHELESASLLGNKALNPPVAGLKLAKTGDAITFQKPLALSGELWSPPIQIRIRNEDRNGNLKLDGGEDLDKNGVLDRVIELLEDRDGNGDYLGPGETRLLARGVDQLAFKLDAPRATIVLELVARFPRFPGSPDAIEHRHQLPIRIRN